MAATIFNPEDFINLKTRIEQLSTESKRQWGKMNQTHMLEHCATQLRLALGKTPSKGKEGPFIFRTSIGRWLSLYVIPWPKGSATPSQMNILEQDMERGDIQLLKQELLDLLDLVSTAPELKPHPFFGQLNRKDWGRLIWKHFDHHLRQFGN